MTIRHFARRGDIKRIFDADQTVESDWTFSGDVTFSGTLTIPEASVTDHEAALTILESQITDGSLLARLAANETITGDWTFAGTTTFSGRILADDGSDAAPGVSFSSDPDSGMSKPSATSLAWSVGGTRHMVLTSTAFNLLGPSLYIVESAAASATAPGRGQLWVKNTTPCQLWFTDDAGTDTQIV